MACGVHKETKGDVVARVGSETLTKEKLYLLGGSRRGDADALSRETKKWVEDELLYRAAISIGLDKDYELIKERDSFYKTLLISSFIKIQTKKKTKTTKKEVSEYYLKNKDTFKRIDDEVVVKHFTFPTSKEAKKIKNQLNKKKSTVDMEEFLKNNKLKRKQ